MTNSNENHYNVIIIGSGPAGLTAAVYNGRANLRTIVFEGNQPGGQLTITTEVENYPGFPTGILGPELMDNMRKQVHRFGVTTVFQDVTDVDFTARPFRIASGDVQYTADAVIIATGASAKLLNLPTEKKFMGYGVSACATCDGFFFKNQEILVVGGGDTAMEEANYLTRFASKVTVIHRRDSFRASKIMVDRVKSNSKISFLFDSAVEEVLGLEDGMKRSMTGAKIRNLKTNQITEVTATGLFIAIGHEPNTQIFKGKIDLDEKGYLLTQPGTSRTNIPGVFAAGDVADAVYRQAITAAGTGCMAAIDAERFLESEGH